MLGKGGQFKGAWAIPLPLAYSRVSFFRLSLSLQHWELAIKDQFFSLYGEWRLAGAEFHPLQTSGISGKDGAFASLSVPDS